MQEQVKERKKLRRVLNRVAELLQMDEAWVVAPNVSDEEPVYYMSVGRKYITLTYKFKGSGAWDAAKAFVSEVKKKGYRVGIDYDSSESEKVFVDVVVPLTEELICDGVRCDEYVVERGKRYVTPW